MAEVRPVILAILDPVADADIIELIKSRPVGVPVASKSNMECALTVFDPDEIHGNM